MDYPTELCRRRQDIAEAALVLAREVEAGRAATPFETAFTELAGNSAPPVRAALLGATAESLQAFLSEVIGHDYNVCKVVVPSRLGYSEVLLHERGFLLDAGAGPQEFPDAETFLSAVQDTHALQQEDDAGLEPLRVKLTAPAHLSGLCLLVPQSLEALHRKPALLSTLADQADWVFLIGDDQVELTGDQRQAVQLMLDHVIGLQNILVATDGAGSGADAWWKGWKVVLSLGLVRLGTDLLRKRLALLTAPGSELRQYLVQSRLLHQCETTLQLMEEELLQVQRTLTTRNALGRDGLLGDAAATDLRKLAESIRTRLAEEGESLLKAAERETKTLMSADGAFNRRAREAAATVSGDDLVHTPGEHVTKLTLGDHVSHRLGELLENLGRERLAADLHLVREGLECSIRDAEAALEKGTGLRHKLVLDLPDEEALWMQLTAATRPEIRYRGEMPRATLMTRFQTARQGIMGLMIMGTLLGGVAVLTGDSGGGGSLRAIISVIMLPLLILGFLWTYISFRRKEQTLLEKEVEKVQDGVLAEFRRSLNDLVREQLAALGAGTQRALRTVHQQIESACERTQTHRQREAEEQRRRQADQQRASEARLSRLRQISQQVGALRNRCGEAKKVQAQWLASWIDRFNKGET